MVEPPYIVRLNTDLYFIGFYINLPIGGLALVIIFTFFRTPKHIQPAQATVVEKLLQLDLLGTFLIMGCLICYILAMQYGGQTHPWNSSIVIGLIVGFILIGAVFCLWEWFHGERAAGTYVS